MSRKGESCLSFLDAGSQEQGNGLRDLVLALLLSGGFLRPPAGKSVVKVRSVGGSGRVGMGQGLMSRNSPRKWASL